MAQDWQLTILTHSALVARVAAEMPRFVTDPKLSGDRAMAILGCIDRCSIAMATLQAHAVDQEASADVQEAAETLFNAWRALADEVSASLNRLRRRTLTRKNRFDVSSLTATLPGKVPMPPAPFFAEAERA